MTNQMFQLFQGYLALGLVVGIAGLATLLTLYNIVANTDAMGEVVFSVPYVQLAVLLVVTVAASLLATLGPALSATRIRPAVALRIVD
jgi:ABC-type lipoprotein release transport system permease subunit